jgi:predicted AlkP superfamily phosphohydrolase/phosphomutase
VNSPTKILLLEIDAGNKTLILNWAAAGILPNLKSLFSNGLVGDVTTPPGVYAGALWPTFFTGVNPARHGIHSLAQLRPGTYDISSYAAAQVKREPFWNYLSRKGKKVAILDFPLSGISDDLNGLQIVEWGYHDAFSGFATHPASLAIEVRSRFGRHPVQNCDADRRTPQDFIAFRDSLVLGIQKKTELTKHYLDRGGWDFFGQVFTESHCVGHQCWHLQDPTHPGYEPDFASIVGNPIRDVYIAIDSAVGEILSRVDNDTTVIVLVGHGMGLRRGAQFLLHEILVRLDVAVPAAIAPKNSPRLVDRMDTALTWGWQRTPTNVKRTVYPLRNRIRAWIDTPKGMPPPKLDPAKGKCFLVENHFVAGGIRLNLMGREPCGLVRPGAESDALCDRLQQQLLDIRNAITGKKAVSRVMPTREIYQGEYLDHLPDLLVEWNLDMPLGTAVAGKPGTGNVRLHSPAIGLVEGENRYCRTGDHLPDGLFAAVGSGIQAGSLGRPVSIMDFAPTVSKLLQVDLPDVDGKPIVELLRTDMEVD